MSTISDGTTTLTPLLVTDPESARDSRNVFHDVIGRSDPDVTLYPDGLRGGTLAILCADEAAAVAMEALHKTAAVFTYTADDVPSMSMTYVRSGKLQRTLDTETRRRWIVSVDFQEVQP